MLRNPYDSSCGLDIAQVSSDNPDLLNQIAYWGYRLVKHPDSQLYVHEAYYGDREAIIAISLRPTTICAEGLDEMREMLEEALNAAREPVLNYTDWAAAPSGRIGET